jgi:formylmethanofuran dehydrogenase subunit C
MLVGMLLLGSALMFVAQLNAESHITKTDAYFKSTLNVAETGMTDTLMAISQAVDPGDTDNDWARAFQNGSAVVMAPIVVDGVNATYTITVHRIGDPGHAGQNTGEVQITSEGRIYQPSVASIVGSEDYAARRAVRMSTQATWTYTPALDTPEVYHPPEYAPTTFDIRYGIFTGGNLTIKGSSQEIQGDVFANGNVYIQKASGLVNGQAYAAGTVTGGIPATSKHPGQTPIPFPEIDVLYMQRMYNAYLMGTYPYDGTVVGMTNTSHSPAGEINRALYHVNDLLNASVVDAVNGLYELPGATGTGSVTLTAAIRAALIDSTAVYFFGGNIKLASNSELAGTIVIDGKFFISGNVEVGASGVPASILVTGDVTKDTGCSAIGGLVYTGGSFTGRGTADITGALIARNTVDMSGNFNVVYDDSLPPIQTGGTLVTAGWTEPAQHTPAQYILDDFKDAAAGQRMWQEVTDLN